MVCLQASIGAVNDLADAEVDRTRKPEKPLASGTSSRRVARFVAAVGLTVGLLLSAPSGVPTVAVAALGVALGYAYDLRLSRTTWSWLPLALALPLLPIHAWLGATGTLPGRLPALVPIAGLAGLGLSLANGLAYHDRDAAAGERTAAVRLGPAVTWRVHALALGAAIALAVVLRAEHAPSVTGWGMAAGTLLVAIGMAFAADGRPERRERGWEAEAAGIVVLGAAWLAGVAAG